MGALISGMELSGSDSKDRESNPLWVSRKAVVSNNDVERFGIPHFTHSYAIFLQGELFRILYIVDDIPW